MPRRRLLIALALGTAATLVAGLSGLVPLVGTLEWKLYDQRVRWAANPAQAREDIVLVDIDELSVRRLEPLVGRWPWPRLVHADVVDFLAAAGARVVAIDVLFTERDRRTGFDVGGTTWTGPESDRALAESVARAGNVVLLADATFEGLADAPASPVSTGPFESRPNLQPPFDELARAARALGHNYFVLDADGPMRRAVPFVEVGGQLVPSLSASTWAVAEGLADAPVRPSPRGVRVGARDVPLVTDTLPAFTAASAPQTARRLLIDFRGPPVLDDGRRTTYRRYSFYDLFYARQEQLAGGGGSVNPDDFRGRIVVIGTTAAGLHDVFAVPFGSSGKMPGAQIHASVIDQLLSARFIEPVGAAGRGGLVAACGLLSALLVVILPMRWAALAAGVVAAGLVAFVFSAFARGAWWPLAQPGLAWALGGVGALAYQYFVEGREKRAVKRLFSRYVSKDVCEQVLKNPALAELGGRRREMTVLFSDIRGFTSMTERGEPEAIVAQLNQYFSRMVDVVFAHRGTLDKFVGDMVMALFGAPLDDADHADHAVEAALAMVAALDALNREWATQDRPALGIGIGINSGEMIAGNIGSEQVRSYTVIGDAVNLGARLESLNKDYRTSIIVSEDTARRLKRRYDLKPLGEVVVKGKSKAVAIFEVRAPGTAGRQQEG